MASLNHQQAGRDAASFDDDRKEGRVFRDRSTFVSDWGSREGDAEKQIALDAAMAQIERALSPETRAKYLANQAAKLGAAA